MVRGHGLSLWRGLTIEFDVEGFFDWDGKTVALTKIVCAAGCNRRQDSILAEVPTSFPHYTFLSPCAAQGPVYELSGLYRAGVPLPSPCPLFRPCPHLMSLLDAFNVATACTLARVCGPTHYQCLYPHSLPPAIFFRAYPYCVRTWMGFASAALPSLSRLLYHTSIESQQDESQSAFTFLPTAPTLLP